MKPLACGAVALTYAAITAALFMDSDLIFWIFLPLSAGWLAFAGIASYLATRGQGDEWEARSADAWRMFAVNLAYWIIVYCVAWSLGLEELPRG